jgi:hypothetical protein
MNKYVIGLVVLAATTLGGYYIGKGQKEVQIEEKIVYKEGETKVEYKDRTIIKEKIIQADGTVIEREITKDISKEIEKRSKELASEMVSKIIPKLSKYSLGVKYWFPIEDEMFNKKYYNEKKVEVTAGYRIVGEVWGQVGYKLDNSISVGLAVQF